MSRIHVGVFRGGPSLEYEVSLASGASVIEHLSDEKYDILDILISKEGQWHARGMPVTPDKALQNIDVAFIALHGEYGEDGTIQKILEDYSIPYTGSGVFASSIAMDKGLAKKRLETVDCIKMPPHAVIHYEDVKDSLYNAAQKVFARFGPVYIVKPLHGGSSVGIAVANSVSDLPNALYEVFQTTDSVIVEQFIYGKEGTCGVIENLREEKIYGLPPIEIQVPKNRILFDYEAKYSGKTEEICPGNFSEKEKEQMQSAAKAVHETLELSHYSRSDFIVAPSGVYFLEVNTLPGLTPNSLLPKSLDAVGIAFPDFLDHLITLSLRT